MMMTKNKRGSSLITEQDIEAALHLIMLKNGHGQFVTTTNSDDHLRCEVDEPLTKIVLKPKEFLKARDIRHKKNICKRKRDGTAWCSSSITFDLDDNSDEDANEAVGSVKKMNKFRSIVDIYNVTKAL
ncbi:hypothetical protein POM88_043798 [Heracleum sosnowskyi]|uniref:Uncharacterized protein n=1 Tax=Heracleum sosnowskyi TaxID=360622 RepID=A0AAD8H418_9APIA|nr:hypothetical protein POM88_043798 [Heracleum sosnowskyi]